MTYFVDRSPALPSLQLFADRIAGLTVRRAFVLLYLLEVEYTKLVLKPLLNLDFSAFERGPVPLDLARHLRMDPAQASPYGSRLELSEFDIEDASGETKTRQSVAARLGAPLTFDMFDDYQLKVAFDLIVEFGGREINGSEIDARDGGVWSRTLAAEYGRRIDLSRVLEESGSPSAARDTAIYRRSDWFRQRMQVA